MGATHPDDPQQLLESDALLRENKRLRRAVSELVVLNDLACEINVAEDLEQIMRMVVNRAIQTVSATEGVISLVESSPTDQLQTLVRAEYVSSIERRRPDAAVMGWMMIHRKPVFSNTPVEDLPFSSSELARTTTSVLCVPLLAKGTLIGILSAYDKKDPAGFTENDVRLLSIIATQSAQVIEGARIARDRDRVLQIFGQHVSPAIVNELLRDGSDVPSRRLPVCVMFLDIRGFTRFSERHPAEEVVAYLNTLFELTIGIVNRHGGIVRQLLGDGFMAMFGAPMSRGDDVRNAAEASLEIVTELDRRSKSGEFPPTRVGIGLHAGVVVAGTVGASERKEYQITGDVVNLAARIEQMNKEFGSQVLVSEAVSRALPDDIPCKPLGEVAVRGRDKPVTIFRLA